MKQLVNFFILIIVLILIFNLWKRKKNKETFDSSNLTCSFRNTEDKVLGGVTFKADCLTDGKCQVYIDEDNIRKCEDKFIHCDKRNEDSCDKVLGDRKCKWDNETKKCEDRRCTLRKTKHTCTYDSDVSKCKWDGDKKKCEDTVKQCIDRKGKTECEPEGEGNLFCKWKGQCLTAYGSPYCKGYSETEGQCKENKDPIENSPTLPTNYVNNEINEEETQYYLDTIDKAISEMQIAKEISNKRKYNPITEGQNEIKPSEDFSNDGLNKNYYIDSLKNLKNILSKITPTTSSSENSRVTTSAISKESSEKIEEIEERVIELLNKTSNGKSLEEFVSLDLSELGKDQIDKFKKNHPDISKFITDTDKTALKEDIQNIKTSVEKSFVEKTENAVKELEKVVKDEIEKEVDNKKKILEKIGITEKIIKINIDESIKEATSPAILINDNRTIPSIVTSDYNTLPSVTTQVPSLVPTSVPTSVSTQVNNNIYNITTKVVKSVDNTVPITTQSLKRGTTQTIQREPVVCNTIADPDWYNCDLNNCVLDYNTNKCRDKECVDIYIEKDCNEKSGCKYKNFTCLPEDQEKPCYDINKEEDCKDPYCKWDTRYSKDGYCMNKLYYNESSIEPTMMTEPRFQPTTMTESQFQAPMMTKSQFQPMFTEPQLQPTMMTEPQFQPTENVNLSTNFEKLINILMKLQIGIDNFKNDKNIEHFQNEFKFDQEGKKIINHLDNILQIQIDDYESTPNNNFRKRLIIVLTNVGTKYIKSAVNSTVNKIYNNPLVPLEDMSRVKCFPDDTQTECISFVFESINPINGIRNKLNKFIVDILNLEDVKSIIIEDLKDMSVLNEIKNEINNILNDLHNKYSDSFIITFNINFSTTENDYTFFIEEKQFITPTQAPMPPRVTTSQQIPRVTTSQQIPRVTRPQEIPRVTRPQEIPMPPRVTRPQEIPIPPRVTRPQEIPMPPRVTRPQEIPRVTRPQEIPDMTIPLDITGEPTQYEPQMPRHYHEQQMPRHYHEQQMPRHYHEQQMPRHYHEQQMPRHYHQQNFIERFQNNNNDTIINWLKNLSYSSDSSKPHIPNSYTIYEGKTLSSNNAHVIDQENSSNTDFDKRIQQDSIIFDTTKVAQSHIDSVDGIDSYKSEKTLEECKRECDLNDNCKAFEYNFDTKICIFYSRSPEDYLPEKVKTNCNDKTSKFINLENKRSSKNTILYEKNINNDTKINLYEEGKLHFPDTCKNSTMISKHINSRSRCQFVFKTNGVNWLKHIDENEDNFFRKVMFILESPEITLNNNKKGRAFKRVNAKYVKYHRFYNYQVFQYNFRYNKNYETCNSLITTYKSLGILAGILCLGICSAAVAIGVTVGFMIGDALIEGEKDKRGASGEQGSGDCQVGVWKKSTSSDWRGTCFLNTGHIPCEKQYENHYDYYIMLEYEYDSTFDVKINYNNLTQDDNNGIHQHFGFNFHKMSKFLEKDVDRSLRTPNHWGSYFKIISFGGIPLTRNTKTNFGHFDFSFDFHKLTGNYKKYISTDSKTLLNTTEEQLKRDQEIFMVEQKRLNSSYNHGVAALRQRIKTIKGMNDNIGKEALLAITEKQLKDKIEKGPISANIDNSKYFDNFLIMFYQEAYKNEIAAAIVVNNLMCNVPGCELSAEEIDRIKITVANEHGKKCKGFFEDTISEHLSEIIFYRMNNLKHQILFEQQELLRYNPPDDANFVENYINEMRGGLQSFDIEYIFFKFRPTAVPVAEFLADKLGKLIQSIELSLFQKGIKFIKKIVTNIGTKILNGFYTVVSLTISKLSSLGIKIASKITDAAYNFLSAGSTKLISAIITKAFSAAIKIAEVGYKIFNVVNDAIEWKVKNDCGKLYNNKLIHSKPSLYHTEEKYFSINIAKPHNKITHYDKVNNKTSLLYKGEHSDFIQTREQEVKRDGLFLNILLNHPNNKGHIDISNYDNNKRFEVTKVINVTQEIDELGNIKLSEHKCDDSSDVSFEAFMFKVLPNTNLEKTFHNFDFKYNKLYLGTIRKQLISNIPVHFNVNLKLDTTVHKDGITNIFTNNLFSLSVSPNDRTLMIYNCGQKDKFKKLEKHRIFNNVEINNKKYDIKPILVKAFNTSLESTEVDFKNTNECRQERNKLIKKYPGSESLEDFNGELRISSCYTYNKFFILLACKNGILQLIDSNNNVYFTENFNLLNKNETTTPYIPCNKILTNNNKFSCENHQFKKNCKWVPEIIYNFKKDGEEYILPNYFLDRNGTARYNPAPGIVVRTLLKDNPDQHINYEYTGYCCDSDGNNCGYYVNDTDNFSERETQNEITHIDMIHAYQYHKYGIWKTKHARAQDQRVQEPTSIKQLFPGCIASVLNHKEICLHVFDFRETLLADYSKDQKHLNQGDFFEGMREQLKDDRIIDYKFKKIMYNSLKSDEKIIELKILPMGWLDSGNKREDVILALIVVYENNILKIFKLAESIYGPINPDNDDYYWLKNILNEDREHIIPIEKFKFLDEATLMETRDFNKRGENYLHKIDKPVKIVKAFISYPEEPIAENQHEIPLLNQHGREPSVGLLFNTGDIKIVDLYRGDKLTTPSKDKIFGLVEGDRSKIVYGALRTVINPDNNFELISRYDITGHTKYYATNDRNVHNPVYPQFYDDKQKKEYDVYKRSIVDENGLKRNNHLAQFYLSIQDKTIDLVKEKTINDCVEGTIEVSRENKDKENKDEIGKNVLKCTITKFRNFHERVINKDITNGFTQIYGGEFHTNIDENEIENVSVFCNWGLRYIAYSYFNEVTVIDTLIREDHDPLIGGRKQNTSSNKTMRYMRLPVKFSVEKTITTMSFSKSNEIAIGTHMGDFYIVQINYDKAEKINISIKKLEDLDKEKNKVLVKKDSKCRTFTDISKIEKCKVIDKLDGSDNYKHIINEKDCRDICINDPNCKSFYHGTLKGEELDTKTKFGKEEHKRCVVCHDNLNNDTFKFNPEVSIDDYPDYENATESDLLKCTYEEIENVNILESEREVKNKDAVKNLKQKHMDYWYSSFPDSEERDRVKKIECSDIDTDCKVCTHFKPCLHGESDDCYKLDDINFEKCINPDKCLPVIHCKDENYSNKSNLVEQISDDKQPFFRANLSELRDPRALGCKDGVVKKGLQSDIDFVVNLDYGHKCSNNRNSIHSVHNPHLNTPPEFLSCPGVTSDNTQ